MQDKTRTVRIMLGICALFLGLFVYDNFIPKPEAPLSDKLAGTYMAGDGIAQCWLGIDRDERLFYYTDQAHERYIQGTIEAQGAGRYELSCLLTENEAVLPNQVIVLDNKRLAVQVDGAELIFTKDCDVVTTRGDKIYR